MLNLKILLAFIWRFPALVFSKKLRWAGYTVEGACPAMQRELPTASACPLLYVINDKLIIAQG